jgi:protein-S-isoprenylcysteine O-methyltransferase Ste14
MPFYTDPFFWALISMIGMQGATSIFTGQRVARNLLFVSLVLVLVTIGRVLLVLPFCPQPRFEIAGWHWIIGGMLFLVALCFAAPAMSIKWWLAPREGMTLRTTGVYAVVRHPIYLSEVLWFLGWAIMWRSVYGLALSPVWWLVFLVHALSEEANLELTLGSAYAEYKRKVRGRIFPGLPV